jgi:hypothetical protein
LQDRVIDGGAAWPARLLVLHSGSLVARRGNPSQHHT